MKKNLLAIIAAAFISVPSLFAFHDLETNHLVSGMPVLFIVTDQSSHRQSMMLLRPMLKNGILQTVLCLFKIP